MKTLLLLFLALLLTPVSAVVLELKDQQVVVGLHLTLNDLVQSSQGVSEEQLALVLAPTPALGQSQIWTRAQIENVLPLSLRHHPLEWAGADSCTIQRPVVEYGENEVRAMISQELIKHLIPGDEFEVLELASFQPFPVPEGELQTEVNLLPGATRNEWTQASLQFHSQGQLAVTKTVRFHWTCRRKIWESTERIKSGDLLNPTHFQQVAVDILKIPGTLQPASDFPANKVTSHVLAQGKILMENDWVEPQLVARNDLVTVLYDHHGVSITLQAKALENGALNSVIQVQNLSSNKIFNARVVQERTVSYE